jgi:hypothetical protein
MPVNTLRMTADEVHIGELIEKWANNEERN